MRKYLKIVDSNRAKLGLRVANYIVDYTVVYSIFIIFGIVAALSNEFLGIKFLLEIGNKLATSDRLTDIIVTSTVYFIYIFSIEYFTKGRSVGKFVTGTKVVSIDATTPTLQQFFIRNISRFVPFDGLSFLGENGWHDSWSDTRVVKIKDFNAANNLEKDIDNLGNKNLE